MGNENLTLEQFPTKFSAIQELKNILTISNLSLEHLSGQSLGGILQYAPNSENKIQIIEPHYLPDAVVSFDISKSTELLKTEGAGAIQSILEPIFQFVDFLKNKATEQNHQIEIHAGTLDGDGGQWEVYADNESLAKEYAYYISEYIRIHGNEITKQYSEQGITCGLRNGMEMKGEDWHGVVNSTDNLGYTSFETPFIDKIMALKLEGSMNLAYLSDDEKEMIQDLLLWYEKTKLQLASEDNTNSITIHSELNYYLDQINTILTNSQNNHSEELDSLTAKLHSYITDFNKNKQDHENQQYSEEVPSEQNEISIYQKFIHEPLLEKGKDWEPIPDCVTTFVKLQGEQAKNPHEIGQILLQSYSKLNNTANVTIGFDPEKRAFYIIVTPKSHNTTEQTKLNEQVLQINHKFYSTNSNTEISITQSSGLTSKVSYNQTAINLISDAIAEAAKTKLPNGLHVYRGIGNPPSKYYQYEPNTENPLWLKIKERIENPENYTITTFIESIFPGLFQEKTLQTLINLIRLIFDKDFFNTNNSPNPIELDTIFRSIIHHVDLQSLQAIPDSSEQFNTEDRRRAMLAYRALNKDQLTLLQNISFIRYPVAKETLGNILDLRTDVELNQLNQLIQLGLIEENVDGKIHIPLSVRNGVEIKLNNQSKTVPLIELTPTQFLNNLVNQEYEAQILSERLPILVDAAAELFRRAKNMAKENNRTLPNLEIDNQHPGYKQYPKYASLLLTDAYYRGIRVPNIEQDITDIINLAETESDARYRLELYKLNMDIEAATTPETLSGLVNQATQFLTKPTKDQMAMEIVYKLIERLDVSGSDTEEKNIRYTLNNESFQQKRTHTKEAWQLLESISHNSLTNNNVIIIDNQIISALDIDITERFKSFDELTKEINKILLTVGSDRSQRAYLQRLINQAHLYLSNEKDPSKHKSSFQVLIQWIDAFIAINETSENYELSARLLSNTIASIFIYGGQINIHAEKALIYALRSGNRRAILNSITNYLAIIVFHENMKKNYIENKGIDIFSVIENVLNQDNYPFPQDDTILIDTLVNLLHLSSSNYLEKLSENEQAIREKLIKKFKEIFENLPESKKVIIIKEITETQTPKEALEILSNECV